MTAIVAFILEYSKCIIDNFKFFGIAIAALAGFFFITHNEALKAQNEALNQELEDEEKALKVQAEIMQVIDEHKNINANGVIERMREDKL